MSFNIFDFMTNNSQLSAANSNCEIFNFGKNSQMQKEMSNLNSQNPNNENSINNQNFLFQNENDYNPENLLFQFNNPNNNSNNKNNIPSQSQRSNSNFFSNNNPDFLNFSQFHYQNQNFEQENNFNFMASDYKAIENNQEISNINRNIQLWHEKANNQNFNYSEAFNNSNSSQMQIENSLKINDKYNYTDNINNNNKINSSNYLNGYQNNLTSSRSSTKSNKSQGFFKNNNTNKSPKHILDTLKIINEVVENENNDDFGFLLQNQTPEKSNLNNQNNTFENKFSFSNNKCNKEDSSIACNYNNKNNIDSCQANISDNNKANIITSVKINNFEDKNSLLQINFSANENKMELAAQIKAPYNVPVYNANRMNQTKADNLLFRNKNNQIDLFASGNKHHHVLSQNVQQEVSESEFKSELKSKAYEKNEDKKAFKNIEISKISEDLDTLENDLFSTLTFKKRNFFDLGNPQSEEIMERFRLGDIEELSKLLNYKGKEYKPDESDFHSVVNKPNNLNNLGVRNRAVENKNNLSNNETANSASEESSLNSINHNKANKMLTGKTIDAGNNYLKFFDSQPPVKEAKSVNNLSYAAINNKQENNLLAEKDFNGNRERIQEKSLNQEQNVKFETIDKISIPPIKTKESYFNKEKQQANIQQATSSDNRISTENAKIPAALDSSSTFISLTNKNQITKINNESELISLKQDQIKIKNYPLAKHDENSLFTIEEQKASDTRIISQIQEPKPKKNQLKTNHKQEEIESIPSSSSNNKIQKIPKEEKVKNFKNNSLPKKITFSIDQVTPPSIEALKNSQKKVNNFKISEIFVPISDEEIENLAANHTLASLFTMFESKKSLVKYANDVMENYTRLFWAVEEFRAKFKKYWEIYMHNYLMEIEYYNFICEKIDENHKYDLNKIELNVMKIAKKYQNDD